MKFASNHEVSYNLLSRGTPPPFICTRAQNCLAIHNRWCLLPPVANTGVADLQETMVTTLRSTDSTAVWRAGPLVCKVCFLKSELHTQTAVPSLTSSSEEGKVTR